MLRCVHGRAGAAGHDVGCGHCRRRTRQAVGRTWDRRLGSPRPDLHPGEDEAAWDTALAFERLVEGGRAEVHALREHGVDADLAPQELGWAEAIILLWGRPAIFIQEGRFQAPPGDWSRLEQSRAEIEEVCRSVGRVEVEGHPAMDWVGTAFLVAPDVAMTNRHVVKEFALPSGDRWRIEPGIRPRIDWAEELGTEHPLEYDVVEVLAVHERHDLALLRLDPDSGPGQLPPPIPLLAERELSPEDEVYVVGYPASDSRRNDPDEMRRIFSGVYNVKRLRPGTVIAVDPAAELFTHDCSTLGGNSGSCVVDLVTHEVAGLHFRGRYLEANWAVDLRALAHDPLLAGIRATAR